MLVLTLQCVMHEWWCPWHFCNTSQWSHSEFSKIPRSCYEKSQDWTKIPKLYWKCEKMAWERWKWENFYTYNI